MTAAQVLKAGLIWLGIAILAIINGVVRDNVVAPMYGREIALPLSGISLAIVVFFITYFTIGFLGKVTRSVCIGTGVQWVMMTLAFEFLFGHYVAGKSWATLMQTFNVASGDLFVVVLLVSLVAPCIAARLRGFI